MRSHFQQLVNQAAYFPDIIVGDFLQVWEKVSSVLPIVSKTSVYLLEEVWLVVTCLNSFVFILMHGGHCSGMCTQKKTKDFSAEYI